MSPMCCNGSQWCHMTRRGCSSVTLCLLMTFLKGLSRGLSAIFMFFVDQKGHSLGGLVWAEECMDLLLQVFTACLSSLVLYVNPWGKQNPTMTKPRRSTRLCFIISELTHASKAESLCGVWVGSHLIHLAQSLLRSSCGLRWRLLRLPVCCRSEEDRSN